MNKIATPQDLQGELRTVLAYCGTSNPSRNAVARQLQSLAERLGTSNQVASDQEYLISDAEELVGKSDVLIRKLQALAKACKGMPELASDFKHSMKSMVDADRTFRSILATLKAKTTSPLTPKDMRPGQRIIQIDHPEYGVWKVDRLYNEDPLIWDVSNSRGGTTVGEGELRFWTLASKS